MVLGIICFGLVWLGFAMAKIFLRSPLNFPAFVHAFLYPPLHIGKPSLKKKIKFSKLWLSAPPPQIWKILKIFF